MLLNRGSVMALPAPEAAAVPFVVFCFGGMVVDVQM